MLNRSATPYATLGQPPPIKLFEHDTVDKKSRNIRLIRIFPGHPDPTIQCEIKQQPLQDDHICLSYARGDPEPTSKILVDGRSLHVRDDLLNFLRGARRHRLEEWLWIDAICT